MIVRMVPGINNWWDLTSQERCDVRNAYKTLRREQFPIRTVRNYIDLYINCLMEEAPTSSGPG